MPRPTVGALRALPAPVVAEVELPESAVRAIERDARADDGRGRGRGDDDGAGDAARGDAGGARGDDGDRGDRGRRAGDGDRDRGRDDGRGRARRGSAAAGRTGRRAGRRRALKDRDWRRVVDRASGLRGQHGSRRDTTHVLDRERDGGAGRDVDRPLRASAPCFWASQLRRSARTHGEAALRRRGDRGQGRRGGVARGLGRDDVGTGLWR